MTQCMNDCRDCQAANLCEQKKQQDMKKMMRDISQKIISFFVHVMLWSVLFAMTTLVVAGFLKAVKLLIKIIKVY